MMIMMHLQKSLLCVLTVQHFSCLAQGWVAGKKAMPGDEGLQEASDEVWQEASEE